jgi:hypothetical protein
LRVQETVLLEPLQGGGGQGSSGISAMSPNVAGSYTRHSVEKDVEEFEGWPKLLDRYDRIKKEQGYEIAQVHGAAFLTGGRVGEVLLLDASMFVPKTEIVQLADGRQIARDVLEVHRMPLEKHYRKVANRIEAVRELPRSVRRRLFPPEPDSDGFYKRRAFETETIKALRKPFDIPMDEVPKEWRVMHEDLKWYLGTMQGQPRLFPSTTKRSPMSRSFIWKKFRAYGIYPHYLRAQRASCLITWNGLSMEQMMEWMSWEELKTAMRYGKMGKSKLLSQFRRYE